MESTLNEDFGTAGDLLLQGSVNAMSMCSMCSSAALGLGREGKEVPKSKYSESRYSESRYSQGRADACVPWVSFPPPHPWVGNKHCSVMMQE